MEGIEGIEGFWGGRGQEAAPGYFILTLQARFLKLLVRSLNLLSKCPLLCNRVTVATKTVYNAETCMTKVYSMRKKGKRALGCLIRST